VPLNYYRLLSTEGPEKQQQTGLLLGSGEYSNRQQYVTARLRNLLLNLLLAKCTRPLPVPDSASIAARTTPFDSHAVLANQPTKQLTKGGDLREAQVDVPLSD
jgi:hypothetical protein